MYHDSDAVSRHEIEPNPVDWSTNLLDYKKLYIELIMAVCQKFPNESRHETALRYIREREQKATEASSPYDLSNPNHPAHRINRINRK